MKVGIVGGSGYTGGELLRLLVQHPKVEVAGVSSERLVGEYVRQAHPNLRNFCDLKFVAREDMPEADFLFFGTPHGVSMGMVPQYLETGVKIVDMSSDFRLRNPGDYDKWYGHAHTCPELLEKSVYGLPELHADEIAKAQLVAGPGCIATSVVLGLAPLKGKIESVIVDSKIGSSAAGNKPNMSTHHPERAGAIRSYKPTGHRHTAEIMQELGIETHLSPHTIELVRGILSTCHVMAEMEDIELWKIYRDFYSDAPFVRLVKERKGVYRYPEPKILAGTNFCDVGFESGGGRIVVMSALDNLTKGSAGQAVQCFNLMNGLDEKTGLWFPGIHP